MLFAVKCSFLLFTLHCLPQVKGRGLLLLYRPKDISNDCAFSRHLRFDLSFGMGMSDTTTLVLRNIRELDYKCIIEIVTDTDELFLVIVIRYPNSVAFNCAHNADAFSLMRGDECLRICDFIGQRETKSPYFILTVQGRINFRFLSNSSLNTDMDANTYQVTATSARIKPELGCNGKNESLCVIRKGQYCFTSGVVCDGIKNCGVTDWYDERKSECELPKERIGYIPVVAVAAATLCMVLAAGHILLRYLPPLANSFFIFNSNEDNRLCVDSVFNAPDEASHIEKPKKMSLIPVSSSTSKDIFEDEHSDSKAMDMMRFDDTEAENISELLEALEEASEVRESKEAVKISQLLRKNTLKTIADMLNRRFGSRKS